MFSRVINLPSQMLPMSQKNVEWRKKHLDWADSKTFFNYSPVRNSVLHKKINYDLVEGKIHMDDIISVYNPEDVKTKDIPDKLQHFPIINSKLNVLRGEETKRVFDFRAVVTNPNAISEIENNKKEAWYNAIKNLISSSSRSDDEYQQKLQSMSDYFTYDWQDAREIRVNALLSHYNKEYNFPIIFNNGFMDAMTVAEEIYQCDIVGGEPVMFRLNPCKVRIFRSGFSNKVEDADVIIIEDYWSPGKVIDTFYDVLSDEDRKYIEGESTGNYSMGINSMGEVDERMGFVDRRMLNDSTITGDMLFDPYGSYSSSLLPWDMDGNVRVLKMYWKSRREIKKVKYYDSDGNEQFDFYPDNYQINKALGEEETIYWINEAWEGTKIGEKIYVNMRPKVVQYNRLSNPSRCHFGIVGTIYNLNDDKPFSMVDMMKPYSYAYDIIHDRLNKLLAKNWGKMVGLDLAKVPKDWKIDKWLYYAKHNNLAVFDSFKEGNYGAATGKLAGGLNNNSTGVIDAELGNSIQAHLSILEYLKDEMGEVVGISKQREGQIANRETVGGVERSTLQSSYITEWLFSLHEDLKKRALECFIETAKAALKGQNKKFSYILSDGSLKIADIDGDEFAENDYGIVIDNSNGSQELNQKLDSLAQAALQNQLISFSTAMKLFNSSSMAEKERMIANDENNLNQMKQQQQQAEQQLQQQQIQSNEQMKNAELQQKDTINTRDNETKLMLAQIQMNTQLELAAGGNVNKDISKQDETVRQFDKKLELEQNKLKFDKEKAEKDFEIKNKQINLKNKSK